MGRYNWCMDEPQFISHWNANTLLTHDPVYSPKHLKDQIKNISLEKIRETASKYLGRSKLNTVIIGPNNEVTEMLSNL